ncbi:MAG: cyclic nucleotide-binding domain-containing protein [Pseudomonadales bacterium]|nr:cyclic nucleotide-binding domain-containing protein [Pseudomonadales bacterium]
MHEVLQKAKVIKYPEGKTIFKREQEDPYVYWLLTGSLDLLDEKFEARNRKAGDDATRQPVDNNSPHRYTAVTTEESRVLRIERATVGLFAPGDHGSDFTITEVAEEEDVDWMSNLLSSPLFEFIPPTNIQTLFSKFEEVKYNEGDAVIKQGEPGDYFYVIQSGQAKVERTSGGKTTLLAELKAGDNFGQDALISDVPRNATVTMLTKGTLMRLAEPDFESLLMSPVLETVTEEEAMEMVAQADPKTYIIDVRNAKELESGKIKGAVNVPLLAIRGNLHKLKPEAVYITTSHRGRRAELAAYILNENGFTAYALKREYE